MAHFAGRREIGVKCPMKAATVHPKSTQLTPPTIWKKITKESQNSQKIPKMGVRRAPVLYRKNAPNKKSKSWKSPKWACAARFVLVICLNTLISFEAFFHTILYNCASDLSYVCVLVRGVCCVLWGLPRLLSWEISRQFRACPQNVP